MITGLGRSGNLRVWALVACAGLMTAACDKLPLLAPQSSTITLSTQSTNVQANGTTQIRATVLEPSGTPVQNGTTVTFTTNLGVVSPTEARTLNGVATSQFLGNGQSGKASVTAISGGAASTALELSVGASAAARVTVTASPTAVPSTGGSTTITAAVVDASGNPIAGVPVSFATTAGTFTSAVVNTDTAGIARTTLTTNQPASVTATAGATTSAATAVTVSSRPTVSISTSGEPHEGGVTTFSIVVTPAASGGSPIQNVSVDYDDGTSDNLGSVSGPISVQHVYDDDGSFTPTVTATDSTGSSVTASTVIFVQPLIVSITATQSGTDPKTFNFTANVSPSAAAGSIASYTWSFGEGQSVTTSSPQASHKYTGSGDKTVRVTARTSTGSSSSGSTRITVPS